MAPTMTGHRFDVSIVTSGGNQHPDLFHGCTIRETPEYLEITPNHATDNTRFIYPWHSINRVVLTELPEH